MRLSRCDVQALRDGVQVLGEQARRVSSSYQQKVSIFAVPRRRTSSRAGARSESDDAEDYQVCRGS